MHRAMIALLLLLPVVAPAGAAAAPPLAAASAAKGEHVWFVVDRGQESGLVLCHHAPAMGGPYFGRAMTMSRAPQAMTAWGQRVWLVHPPAQLGQTLRREAFTLEVKQDLATGLYRTIPAERLAIVQPLPPEGELAGFVATEPGPVALLVGIALQDRSEDLPEAPPEALPGALPGAEALPRAGVRLLQLRGEHWIDIALPAELQSAAAMRLGAGGEAGERLSILASIDDDAAGARAVLYQREIGGEWSRSELPLRVERVHSVLSFNGRLAVVRETDSPRQIEVAYVRPGAILPLAQLQIGSDPWAVVAADDGFRLLAQSARGDVTVRSIDPITGAMGEAARLRDQPVATGRLWHMALMLAVAVAAILIVVLVRPGSKGPVKLPEGLAPLPLMPRLMALLADLFPGGLIAVLVLRVPPAELLRLPIATDSLEHAAPFLIMALVTVAHSTITEMLKQTTLGKALAGAKLISQDGSAPGAVQILVRNGLKLMILLVPPLAVFALLSPHLQGFNDLLARTVVVREVEEEGQA